MSREESNIKWLKWCEDVWKQNGDKWINRTGQDHFYRRNVVVPAFLNSIAGKLYNILIDIGSGDGYTTNLLLENLKGKDLIPKSIFLIDRSVAQMEKAITNPLMHSANIIEADLMTNNWITRLGDTQSPRLLLSIFVIQEIPDISILFKNIGKCMQSSDRYLAIIVNPDHSTRLEKEGKVIKVELGNENTDWKWVGKYPIPLDDDLIYLPHFERDLSTYKKLAEENGLIMDEPELLSVPDTIEARNIFGKTIYGEEIINARSSVLLTFLKT